MNYSAVWRAGVLLLLCVGILATDRAFADLTLESSFSVATAYTSNLFFDENNTDADLGTFVGPNVSLIYNNPDIVIGATYFGRLAFFINNSNANTYIQGVNIILDLPFLTKRYEKLTVSIDEGMTFTPQLDAFSLSGAEDENILRNRGGAGGRRGLGGAAPGADAEGAPGGPQGGLGGGTQGVFTRRADAFLNRAGIRLGYAWSPRVQPYLGYTNQYRHFFSSGFQDSIRHGVNLGLGYAVNQRTRVTPSYSYFQTDFKGSTQDTSADKIIAHSGRLGVSYRFTPTLSGTINGGATFSKQIGAEETEGGTTEQITNKWAKNFTGGATLNKTYSRQGSVSLSVRQTIGSGGGLASQTTRTRVATASIRHRLSQRMNANGSLGWAQNDSTDGDAFDAATYRIQAGLGYTFTAWLFGTLGYSHIHQKSDGSAADDLNVDSVFLGLTAVADPWLIHR
jgi:hypothetical protein